MAEEDQVVAEEAAPERPEWLPEQYDSPEAFAKAYTELKTAYDRQGNELGEYRENMDALTTMLEEQAQQPPQQQFQPDPNEHPLVQRLNYARETGNTAEEFRVMAEFQKALLAESAPPAPQEPQQDMSLTTAFAENMMRANNPDYDNHREKVIEILQANPGLIGDGSNYDGVTRGLDTALQIARGQSLYAQQQAEQKAAAQAEADRQAKLQAQTLQGSGTRPETVTEASQVWERIKAADSGGFRL